MSFFSKGANLVRTGNNFFKKNVKPMSENFFRKKSGGLDKMNVAFRQGKNTLNKIAGGVEDITTNPTLLAGLTAVNPALAGKIAVGGQALTKGLGTAGALMQGGQQITNRRNYAGQSTPEVVGNVLERATNLKNNPAFDEFY